MIRPKQKVSRVRRWIENILLLGGVVGVGLWGAANLVPIIWQDWGNWDFDRELRGETATVKGYLTDKLDAVTREVEVWFGFTPVANVPVPATISKPPAARRPSPGPGENALVGRITIPRLHLTAIVREGVGRDTLGFAVGHIPGTAFPGQNGNVAVAGHRDTLFLGLKGIQANDVVKFETLEGSYEYQVKSTEIVTPKDVSVLNPGKYDELTLVTCYPFSYIGPAPDRFIVKARQVSQTPALAESAESQSASEALRKDLEEETSRAKTDGTARNQPERGGMVSFSVSRNHSQTLAPGISIGIDDTDAANQRVKGWMWIMPDRRTIWLKDQPAHDPVVFYGYEDGKKRELLINQVTNGSASGYLLLPAQ
jgi:sortase A